MVGDASTSSLLLVRAHAIKSAPWAGSWTRCSARASRLSRLDGAVGHLRGEFLEVYKGVVPECVDWIRHW